MYGERNYWRETQRPARFLCFDSRIVIFIALVLIHFRTYTVILLIIASIVSLWLDWRRSTPADLVKHLRTFLAGPVVPARRRSDLRRPVDFGFETYSWINNPPAKWRSKRH